MLELRLILLLFSCSKFNTNNRKLAQSGVDTWPNCVSKSGKKVLVGIVLQGPVRQTDLGPRTGPDWDRSFQFFLERPETTAVLGPERDGSPVVLNFL